MTHDDGAAGSELDEIAKFFRHWFGLGPNPNVGYMLDRLDAEIERLRSALRAPQEGDSGA